MKTNPFAPKFDQLPQTLPVFPLDGVLLMPFGQLPLNIFEPRYLDMIREALSTHRMIGMIQPRNNEGNNPPLYSVGCAGKITEFTETEDGRFLITLSGICRFDIAEELEVDQAFRSVRPDWSAYEQDMHKRQYLDGDREKLYKLLGKYFDQQDMSCDFSKFEDVPDGKLITCLSMVCTFAANEKQALLEKKCCAERAQMFMTMLEMAIEQGHGINIGDKCH